MMMPRSDELWEEADGWQLGRPVTGWRILYVGRHCKLFPFTCRAWEAALRNDENAPEEVGSDEDTNGAIFYYVAPGARLLPHEGRPNQMVFQLGIQCPANYWLRVGNISKDYREGEMVMFEDSWEHELVSDYQGQPAEDPVHHRYADHRIVFASVFFMEDYFNKHVRQVWHRQAEREL